MSQPICTRRGCTRSIPPSMIWRKSIASKHCGWEHYYEDAYDAAERDAAAEGLTGATWRARASALFLERADVAPRSQGRPRKVEMGAEASA